MLTSAAPPLCGVEYVFEKERRGKEGAAEVRIESVTEITLLLDWFESGILSRRFWYSLYHIGIVLTVVVANVLPKSESKLTKSVAEI